MAKVAPRRRPVRKERQTNWYLLGGLIAIGVVGLFALLFLSLQGGTTPVADDQPAERVLEGYCERNPDRCMVRGDSAAPVTIVEVSDYGCIHCRNFNMDTAATLDDAYVESGEVRWISVPFALSTTTLPAAESALCAGEQDSYWEYHHALFEQHGSDVALTRAGFLQAAEAVGLDVDAFAACLDGGAYTSIVQSNMTAAQQAGVSATPTFFVNGVVLPGNRPFSDFQSAIAAAQES